MGKTWVVVNPEARDGRFMGEWPHLKKEIFKALNEKSPKVVFTTRKERGAGWVRAALLEGATQVVVVGGDGTLSEAIQGFFEGDQLIAPHATLIVMPVGRGNDFFKALTQKRFYSSKTAWNCALDLIHTGNSTPVDVGRLRWIGAKNSKQRYFINITSFGFPGLVVQGVQKRSGYLGKTFVGKSALTYGLQGITAIGKYKPLTVKIRIDDQEFYDGKIQSGFVMNGLYNAGGLCWDPYARLNDGLFNIVVIEPCGLLNNLRNTSMVLLGSMKKVKGIHRAYGKKVEILLSEGEIKTHPLFEMDGDVFEDSFTRGASFEVVPGAIRLKNLVKL